MQDHGHTCFGEGGGVYTVISISVGKAHRYLCGLLSTTLALVGHSIGTDVVGLYMLKNSSEP